MTDLLLTNDDLTLIDGDLATVTESEQLSQWVVTRLRTFLGEWAFDLDLGLPYYEEVFVKSPNLSVVDAYIKAVILATPGVVDLVSYASTLDVAARTLAVTAEYYDEWGQLTELEEVL